ncbi:MAG: hypothetical protein EXX96DRAFT_582643 [Benjaminiella poitrasii]|nr:MAG: hypothetical protein EXX96DRAFT_582643 [Benjaminiella poitrasii]
MIGQYTPFAYPWRQVKPDPIGDGIAWIAYVIHQLGQWLILSRVQSMSNIKKWTANYQWWNWQMVYLNSFMLFFKLVHGHIFYDGLAIHVPEGVAQGSVILVLVLVIIIAIPYRGIIFGRGKISPNDPVVKFIRKYHGYAMSFGTVLNFHYHPVEGTMGHCFGFIYQCLLIWQSTNFLHKSHRNKSWILLLETWVFLHGTLTALIQPGIGWQIFSYGFMLVFLLNQIFQIRLNKRQLVVTYLGFSLWAYWGFRKDKAYYRATFIPVAEYLCVAFTLAIGKLTQHYYHTAHASKRGWLVIVSYVSTVSILTVGLALILAGNLRVYNDY